jgi:hypothetical protein
VCIHSGAECEGRNGDDHDDDRDADGVSDGDYSTRST